MGLLPDITIRLASIHLIKSPVSQEPARLRPSRLRRLLPVTRNFGYSRLSALVAVRKLGHEQKIYATDSHHIWGAGSCRRRQSSRKCRLGLRKCAGRINRQCSVRAGEQEPVSGNARQENGRTARRAGSVSDGSSRQTKCAGQARRQSSAFAVKVGAPSIYQHGGAA